jgi:RNA polymerase sigma-70 factor (ECF subfamily)
MTETNSPPTARADTASQEAQLLKRVRDRTDSAAWTEFARLYQPMIRAFVRRHGVAASDVSDIVQDIFARLIPTLARFRFDPARGRFRTWLWRVSGNAAANWNRKRVSRTRTEAVWRERRSENSTEDDFSDSWGQNRRLLERVLTEIRKTTLPATWACFEGRILRALSARELAAELGVSQNAVYVNASRVLARVRKRCVGSSVPVDWTGPANTSPEALSWF